MMDAEIVNNTSQLVRGGRAPGTDQEFQSSRDDCEGGGGLGRVVVSTTTTQTYHQHVDYTSKALERQAELEELRKKALAKDKAVRLQGAEVPKETLENFMNRQRAMFDERRKNEAEALHALHQYRADDELVLRLKSNNSKSINNRTVTATNMNASSTDTLTISDHFAPQDGHENIGKMVATRGEQNQKTHVAGFSSDAKQVEEINNRGEKGTFCILTERIEYNKARLSFMQKVASEACQVPLPPDDDDEGDDEIMENDDNRTNQDDNGISNKHDIEEGDEQTIRSDDPRDHSNGILIAEEGTVGSHDDVNNNDNNFDQGSSQSFIPYESFLKLGEAFETDTVDDDADSVATENSEEIQASRSLESSTTVSSTIPIESFLQLGATLMVESTPSQQDYTLEKASAEKIKHLPERTDHYNDVVIPGNTDDDEEDKTQAMTDYPSQAGDDQVDSDEGRMIVGSLSSTLTDSIPKAEEATSSFATENWTISSSTLQLVKAQDNNSDPTTICEKEEEQQNSSSNDNVQEQTAVGCSEDMSPPVEVEERSSELDNESECPRYKSSVECLPLDSTVTNGNNKEERIDENSPSMVVFVDGTTHRIDSDVALETDLLQQQQQQQQQIEVTGLRLEESADNRGQTAEIVTSTSTHASTVRMSPSSRRRVRSSRAQHACHSFHRPSSIFVGRQFFSR